MSGDFVNQILVTRSGILILIGVAICVSGIGLAGMAGISKERDLPPDKRTAIIKEFNLKKGLVVATFCGIMSACFSYGLAAGGPVRQIAERYGAPPLWQGLPILVLVLAGGFTTNVIWCIILHIRNRTGAQYFQERNSASVAASRFDSITFCAHWRGSSGISNSSFTRWVRRRWEPIAFRVGRCTWPVS